MKLIPLLVLGSSNLASALQKILWIDGITDSGFGASFVPKINENKQLFRVLSSDDASEKDRSLILGVVDTALLG